MPPAHAPLILRDMSYCLQPRRGRYVYSKAYQKEIQPCKGGMSITGTLNLKSCPKFRIYKESMKKYESWANCCTPSDRNC